MEAYKKLVIVAVVLGNLAIASEATYFGRPQVVIRICGMNQEDLMACTTNDAALNPSPSLAPTASNPSPPPAPTGLNPSPPLAPRCCSALSMADFNCICAFKKYSSMFKPYGIDFSNPFALLARCNLTILINC